MDKESIKQLRKDLLGTLRSHPHYARNKFYAYGMGLTQRPTDEIVEWLNNNTLEPYSIDFTIPPYNISFSNKNDAMLFKLTWGGEITCPKHVKT